MRIIAIFGIAASASACAKKPKDATAEGVVREFLDRIERLQQNEAQGAHSVVELLSHEAQANLAERARRASAATGTRMKTEQMLASSHFFTHFQPRQWNTQQYGQRAVVNLVGLDAESERASIPCVLEEGHWRVALALPALPPVERRPEEPLR